MPDDSKSTKISYNLEVEIGKSLTNLEKVKDALNSINDIKFTDFKDEYRKSIISSLNETGGSALELARNLEKISKSLGLTTMTKEIGDVNKKLQESVNASKEQIDAAKGVKKATEETAKAQDDALDKFLAQSKSIKTAINEIASSAEKIRTNAVDGINLEKAADNVRTYSGIVSKNVANIKKELHSLAGNNLVKMDLGNFISGLNKVKGLPKDLSVEGQREEIRALRNEYTLLSAAKAAQAKREAEREKEAAKAKAKTEKNAKEALTTDDSFSEKAVKAILEEYAEAAGLLDGIKKKWLEIANVLDTKVNSSLVNANDKTVAMVESTKKLAHEINESFKNIKIPEPPRLNVKGTTAPKAKKPSVKSTDANEDIKDYTERLSRAWENVGKSLPVSAINALAADTRSMYEYLWNAAHIDFSSIANAFAVVNEARDTLKKFGKDVVEKAAERKAQAEAEKKESSKEKKAPEKPEVKTLDSQIRAKEEELRKAYASGKKTNDTKVDVSKQQNDLVQLLKKGAEQDESLGKYARALARITQAEALLQQLGNGDFAQGINRADRDARKYLTTLETLRRHFEELKRSVSRKLGEEPAKRLEAAQKEHDKLVNSGWNSRDNGTILNERKWEQARQRIIALRKVLSELKGDLSTTNPFSEGKYADYVKNVQNQPMSLRDIEKARSGMKVTNLFDEEIKQQEQAAKKSSALLKKQMEEEAKAQKEETKQAEKSAQEREKVLQAEQKTRLAIQKARQAAQKKADAEEAARQEQIANQLKALEKVKRRISQHTGKAGLVYTQNSYITEKNRIEDIAKALKQLGEEGKAVGVDESMLKGVNVKKPAPLKDNKVEALSISESFNARLSEARKNAQDLYLQFQKTNSITDKIGFERARTELRLLNRQAERFNEEISKAPRHALNIENILRRARESANWAIGSSIENHIISFPSDVVSDVSKYELAMAGIAQVLPKVEEGQAAMNGEFSKFASIGAQFGQSADNVLEAARSVGRLYGQGGGDADVGAKNTEILTAQAAKMATTDNFEMKDAVLGLESALSQFNMQTEDSNLLMARSTHILDVWTKLAHTSGASAQDLTEGVKQSGAAANAAGVSFGFLNALIATGVRTTAKSGNEIGTMLKSLFASIQSDKAVKAMQKFGIEVYKIGANGKKELRPVEDLILDISKGLQHTNLDSKSLSDFMLAISGGKWQSSKTIALLNNYNELKRTIELTKDSAGFTDQQLALQMDTVARKVETLKANIAKLFMSNGNNGLVNDIKWILNLLNSLLEKSQKGTSHAYQFAKGILAIVAAYKLLPPILRQIASLAGKTTAMWEVGAAQKNAGIISSLAGNLQAAYASGRSSYMTQVMNIPAATSINKSDSKSSATVNSIRQTKEYRAELERLITTDKKVVTSTKAVQLAQMSYAQQLRIADRYAKANAVSTEIARVKMIAMADAGRLAAAGMTAASMAARVLNIAFSAFGGPIGVIITLLAVVVPLFLDFSEATDKVKESLETEVDTLSKEVDARKKNIEMTDSSIEKAQELKEAIESGKLSEEELATSKSKLIDIDQHLTDVFGADAAERIKQAGYTTEAYNAEKDNYITATNAKEEKLKEANTSLYQYYLNQVEWTNKERDRLEKSIQNFGKWTTSQLDGLNILQKAYAMFYQFRYNMDAQAIEVDKQSIESLKEEQESLGDGLLDTVLKKIKEAQIDNIQRHLDWVTEDQSEVKGKALEDIQGYLDEENKKAQEAIEGLQKVTPYESKDITEGRNNEGKDSENFGSGRGGSGSGRDSSGHEKKEPKEYINYSDEQQQAIATVKDMMSRGDFSKYGVKESSLFSLLNLFYGKGAKNTDFSGISDLFATGGSDPFDSAYKLLEKFGNLASQGLSEGEIWKKLYGNFLSDEQLDKVLPDYIEEFDKKYNSTKYSRDYSRNDEHRMTEGSRLNAGGYDYSSFTNPYLAELAVRVSKEIQDTTGRYITPNMMYGQFMSETPNVTEFTTNAHIGGYMGSFKDEADLIDELAKTYIRGDAYNGMRYDDAKTATDWYNVGHTNAWPEDEDGYNYSRSIDQYANESGWNTATQTIGENIGEAMVKEADAHAGEQWRGIDAGFDDNSTWESQCSSWVSYMMNKHGITSVNSPNGDTLMEQAGSAYHAGEAPLNAGDIINWNKHVGIYDGNGGYIARNSSGGVHHGTMEEAQQYFGAVLGRVDIKELAQANGVKYGSPSISSSESVDRWEKYRGENAFHRNGIEEAAYRYETDQKRYEREQKRLETEAKLSGYTAKIYKKIAENEEAKLKSTETTLSYWRAIQQNGEDFLKDYSDKFSGFKGFLSENNLSIEGIKTLPDSEIQEIAKKFDKEGKGDFTKAINSIIKSRSQLDSLESKYVEDKAERDRKVYGSMSPTERLDAQLESLSNAHEYKVNGMTDNESYMENMRFYAQKLDILQKKYDWIHSQLSKAESSDYEKRSGWETERDAEQKRLDLLIEKRKTLTSEDKTLNAEIQKVSKHVDELTDRIDQNREHGGEATQQYKKDLTEVQKSIDDVKKSLNAVTDQLADIIENGVHSIFSDVLLEGKSFKESWKALWSDIAKLALQQILKVQMQKWGLKDILSGENITRRVQRRNFVNNIGRVGGFMSGWSGNVMDRIPSSRYGATNQFGGKADYTKAFSDLGQKLAINSTTVKGASAVTNAMSNATRLLTKETILGTAKTALDTSAKVTGTATTTANTSVMDILSGSVMTLNGTMMTRNFFPMAAGGLIPKFATGGDTTGLIGGAGTGTSDSILTYLANRGQFIRTSNGEYIIKKSTVDKVGVSFLDTLNANPEAIAGMKRYADGGDLGESYEPVMSPKTVENYRKFNRNNTVIKTSSNKRLEQLMQQQNDMLAAMGSKDNGSGNMVVLNTQADSASVMRAIQKNPRAFQRIMGNQQRHGFR
jgi:TP901 family phage tail tape measure protein